MGRQGVDPGMKSSAFALALGISAALPLRAEENGAPPPATHPATGFSATVSSTGSFAFELFLNTLAFGLDLAALDSAAPLPAAPPVEPRGYEQQHWAVPRRLPQAREGLLVSFGLGGGSAYLSSEGAGRVGVFDGNFRLGYGFSDRFQLFMQFSCDWGRYPTPPGFASWPFSTRGPTVLIAARAGTGLNPPAGVGVAGLDSYGDYCCSTCSSVTGLALAGGIS